MLDDVFSLPNPSRIDQFEGNPIDVDVFLDDVPGGSFDIGHDGFFLAKKIIEEARLADVWTTDDSSRDPFTQDLTATGSLEEIGQEGFKFTGLFTDDLSGCFFDIIVLRIVDIDFDLGQGIKDFLARVVDQVRQGTV